MKTTVFLYYFALFVTTAHAQGGVPLWTNRYNGPGNGLDDAHAIAVDDSGNVFVTGGSIGNGSDYDYATIKYSNTGVPLWTNRYHGPGNRDDIATAIDLDTVGNVLVTGYSGYPISTNGLNDYDYATVAYSSLGLPLWTNRYGGTDSGNDVARCVVGDGHGNVFVTGGSVGSDGDYDYATIKYSSAGAPLWTNRYNGPGQGSDEAWAMAIDGVGNVIVTGASFGGINSSDDYATIMYSTAGMPLWTNRHDGFGNRGDRATDIATDINGNVIVTGWTAGTNNYADYTTIKYSSTGAPLWTNCYDGLGNNDYAIETEVDFRGDVIVVGYSWNWLNNDYATIKYSTDGKPLWTNRYSGTGSSDIARALAVDSSGSVFVAGSSTNNGMGYDYTTIKYSDKGVPLWTNRYNGPGNRDDYPRAIALDESGNIFLTGMSIGSSSYYDYATIAYANVSVSPIPIAIQKLDNQLVLSWTNARFGLQSAPDIGSTFTNIPSATSPYTNPISGSRQFFRLIVN